MRIPLETIRELLTKAAKRNEETAQQLLPSTNPQSHDIGLQAQARADAYKSVLDALNGDATCLRIDARSSE